ncbi:MAG: hypothetical protein GY694_13770 [Gammaproteobacteria bacterium]|nr:hypothetical protein [Gammaproteobacteria bacterium]
MELIFEFIFSIFGELLLQIMVEVLIELGFNGVASTFQNRKNRSPLLAFIGYSILGGLAGALSLWVVPHQVIESEAFALLNLFITPIVAGLLMSYLGYLRKRKGKDVIRLDSFIYGFTFAFAMALVRYYFGA